jgi:hypothetical protein
MAILTLAFSMFLGFLGGYFAARIAVDRAMFDNNKTVKSISESQYEANRDIVGLQEQFEALDESLQSMNAARTSDGDVWNSNFSNIKEFMRQQTALNAQVNQALNVLNTLFSEQTPYLRSSDDEVLYNGQPAEASEEEA